MNESLKEFINQRYGILSLNYPLLAQYGADFDGDLIDGKVVIGKKMEEKEMNRKITLVGSMKFKDAMMEIYNRFTLRGDCVLLPYMGTIPEDADEDIIEKLHELHKDKMRMSDFVVVVDQDGYIGKDTQADIKWCESQGKRIIYASDLAMTEKTKPYKIQK